MLNYKLANSLGFASGFWRLHLCKIVTELVCAAQTAVLKVCILGRCVIGILENSPLLPK